MCCATKRLSEINCPADCPYLASARDHPAASVVRRQQRDAAFVMQFARDFNERQSQLFLFLAGSLLRHGAEGAARSELADLQPLIDDDVAEAMRALASTYETAVRGVIYDHRPASLPAQRLVAALKPLLAEAGKNGGTAFERDAAVVLRRIEQGVGELRESAAAPIPSLDSRRAFLDLLGRVFSAAGGDAPPAAAADAPRLIVP